ncbi:MAG: hypothetical protein JNG88_05300 [Phycisphaerales bacterium]|nr:hypothetical protein [Phycisphaerales bacterium]
MRKFLTSATQFVASVMVVATSVAPTATGGVPQQVNGAGATLFVDASRNPGLTNDWIDADGDGNWGFYDSDGDGVRDSVDQLAPTNPNNPGLHWIYQYRSVGSIEGFGEWISFQTCGDLPEVIPSERGVLNSLDWAVTGVPNSGASNAGWGPACTADTDVDGIPNSSNTPVCPNTVDFGNIDVPSLWGIRVQPLAECAWDRKPGEGGYGMNNLTSNGAPAQQGESNLLESYTRLCGDGSTVSLNTNVSNPDQFTVYDTQIAWSPVAYLCNRGVAPDANFDGAEDGTFHWSDLQHGYVTGRSKNGENLAYGCRDVGSGTRNTAMNSIGVDPSWGLGDHVGRRINQDTLTRPGPDHQVNNCGGSSIMESAVENRRLAIGYTGVFGSSRAVDDARAGRYEIMLLIKDIDGDKDGDIDATLPVGLSLDAILDNCDPNAGWQVGAIQTLTTVGNPRASAIGRVPASETGPQMSNLAAAAFIRNIEQSILDFDLPLDAEQFFMPGDVLATRAALVAGVDCLPGPSQPAGYSPNVALNQAIQDYIRTTNTIRPGGASEVLPYGDIDSGGTTRTAGLSPRRRAPVSGMYRDGGDTANAGYVYYDAANTLQRTGTAAGQALSRRNRVQGDLNNDGRRNINDIEKMVEAEYKLGTQTTATFLQTFEPIQGGHIGSMAVDRLIVHVVGDLNGDGEYNKEDIRYAADGTAIDTTTHKLNRKAGFIRADNAWLAWSGGNNLFGTILATGTYASGDSRGDVAGSANGAAPGADPRGFDGVVDADDIDYVCANYVTNWANTDLAACRDLSADLDGDLDVDYDDVVELVVNILDTQIGDVNLDGAVDAADIAIIEANLGNPGGWAQGDLNCDGQVTQDDLDLIAPCGGDIVGDSNCDGNVNNFDIDCFVAAVVEEANWVSLGCGAGGCDYVCVNDTNGDAVVNNFDIDSFVNCVVNLGCQ